MIRVAAIGEAMVELTHIDDGTLRLGFAGDTLNTATYLARAGGGHLGVDFVSRVGDDWYGERMVERIEQEGIGTALLERVPGTTPGLYLVRTDAAGERSFTYHRNSSPARGLFSPDQPERFDDALASYAVVYLSAITLQILAPSARARLWRVLDVLRSRGGKVAFDSNFRPSGWQSAEEAREAVIETLRRTDIALPTFDDERILFGDATPVATARRIAGLGVGEVAVKDGAEGCVVHTPSLRRHVAAQTVDDVVDTTGAGDSFNGAYLAARLRGLGPAEAAAEGHRQAAEVIRWPGAIVSREPREVSPGWEWGRELILP